MRLCLGQAQRRVGEGLRGGAAGLAQQVWGSPDNYNQNIVRAARDLGNKQLIGPNCKPISKCLLTIVGGDGP